METVDKETQKSWKTKAKEKSITIKALEKEKRRLQIQSQSYRSTNKMLRLALAEKRTELKAISSKTTETGIQENVSKKKIKELVL
jgi:hypothetical protein